MDCEVCKLPNSGERIYDCERLHCRMTPGWCELYIRDGVYHLAWEEGRGPGQRPLERPDPTREPKELPPAMPPTREQVVSFLRSMAQFMADGFRVVDGDEFERRVEICRNCRPWFNAKSGRCSACGCYGRLKARGKVWDCPKGFWGE